MSGDDGNGGSQQSRQTRTEISVAYLQRDLAHLIETVAAHIKEVNGQHDETVKWRKDTDDRLRKMEDNQLRIASIGAFLIAVGTTGWPILRALLKLGP